MTQSKKLGFIGAGNMASALIEGIIESRAYDPSHIQASDTSPEALQRVSRRHDVVIHQRNSDLVRESRIILLSVKPQNMKDVLEGIKGEIRDDHMMISIAAGIPLKMIHDIIAREIPTIRVMPNTPALVQTGISALAKGPWAEEAHMAIAKKIFDAVGESVEVEEPMMDAVTAVSGSGPAYVFRIMECMVSAGVAVGLEEDTALRLVMQTFLGAACLAKESEDSLASLRERVTSPGGTTEAGLKVFESESLDSIIHKAVEAACRRSVELGKA